MPSAPGYWQKPDALHLGGSDQQRQRVLALQTNIVERHRRAAAWKSLPGFSLGSVWLIVPLAHHPPAVLWLVCFEILREAHPPFIPADVAHVIGTIHTDLGADAIVLLCLAWHQPKFQITTAAV